MESAGYSQLTVDRQRGRYDTADVLPSLQQRFRSKGQNNEVGTGQRHVDGAPLSGVCA